MCPRGMTGRTQLLPGNPGSFLLDGRRYPSCVHFSPMVVATPSFPPDDDLGPPDWIDWPPTQHPNTFAIATEVCHLSPLIF